MIIGAMTAGPGQTVAYLILFLLFPWVMVRS